jgi:hypothetical protein
MNQPTPLWRQTLDKAVEEWILQGRSDEQIHGVQNFLSGKGGTAIENLIQEVIEKIPDDCGIVRYGKFEGQEEVLAWTDKLKRYLRQKYGKGNQ